MRRVWTVLVAACACMAVVSFAWAGTPPNRVEVEDPAGDLDSTGEHPGKDVTKVVLDSDGTALHVDVTLAKEAAFYLDGHLAGDVVRLQIDTDGDVNTGGKLVFGRKPGFDMELKVGACIKYESGEACAGGLGGMPVTGFFSSFEVGRYAQDEPFSKDVHDEPFWKSPRQPITGRQVKVSVPYSELGLKSGQTLRIAIRESDAGMSETAYSPDVSLTLK